ncbi:MAG: thioredoxin family protein [Tenericutes bacterium]|jgi:thiol-disulfide isomerase/thioredoxin|nr:thioredoxin family protein [Mycoplasmatota bacterium]
MKKEKKKQLIIIIIFIVIIIGTFIISSLISEENQPVVNPLAEFYTEISEEEQKPSQEITVNEYFEIKATSSKPAIIYITRLSCGACTLQTPVFNRVLHSYDLDAYSINIDNISEAEYYQIIENEQELIKDGTPTFVIVKDNAIINKIVGLTGTEDLVKTFKDYGIIGGN